MMFLLADATERWRHRSKCPRRRHHQSGIGVPPPPNRSHRCSGSGLPRTTRTVNNVDPV